jgi:hypothetical protein
MTMLDFAMEFPFECAKNDAGDVAFTKATHCIGGWDTVEEYMAYGLFPLSASFSLGEVEDKETLVSKVNVHMPEFPVARLLDEMNDCFHTRVELAVENVVGSMTHASRR